MSTIRRDSCIHIIRNVSTEYHVYPFARRIKKSADELETATRGCAALSFAPSRLVHGIIYHVIDEGIATAVEPESCEAAMHSISHNDQPTITKERWTAMGNAQRLQWLLKQGHITVKPKSDGSAMLAFH